MKTNFSLIITLFLSFSLLAQNEENYFEASYFETTTSKTLEEMVVGNNGFDFTTIDTGINTKFSEFGSGFFMNKFIMVSAKKLGGLAKTDKTTNEGYRNLFCVDINKDGTLDNPILFSRIINTLDNEDQISFLPDGQTMFYTRSKEGGSPIYKLYKTELEKNSKGNWINHVLLDINVDGYSIENPYVNKKGNKIYFSSNKPGGFGGYDLYVAKIKPDGTLYEPVNLGENVNTPEDDKYPSLSIDGNQIYYSSKGHNAVGGFDIFTSKVKKNGYGRALNLGSTINTKYDEVAFFLSSKTKGYMSSDKAYGQGKQDIYKFDMKLIAQQLEGVIVDRNSKIPLPNAEISLIDEDGKVIDTVISDEEANYKFEVSPYETYTITATKEGFEDNETEFIADDENATTYNKDLELDAEQPEIVEVEEKKMIIVNNIYFEYNKAAIKQESEVPLKTIVYILKDNPEMKIEINAYTDNRGNNNYNLRLSDKRAASAMQYLIDNGVDASRLISRGYGETQPKYDCKTNCTEEEHQANRRVEFVIIE